ncbi:Uncharacterised protein [Klebsiella pneumoniae]|nr:Uncharacterised protein [Klebsiella pneumoniae]
MTQGNISFSRRFLIQSAIEAFIAMVLEDGKIQRCLHACLLGRFNQMFIMFSKLIAQKQSLFILS